MTKDIVKNKKQWDAIIDKFGNDISGLGINDYKGNYYNGDYTPEKYPFILIRGDYESGCTFDHEEMIIIYTEDFNRDWIK